MKERHKEEVMRRGREGKEEEVSKADSDVVSC